MFKPRVADIITLTVDLSCLINLHLYISTAFLIITLSTDTSIAFTYYISIDT